MLIRRASLIIAFALSYSFLSTAQQLVVDVEAAKALISEWNDGHTADAVENLSSLYAGNVTFYGSVLPRSRCMTIKRGLMRKNKDFQQTLKGHLVLTGYETGVVRVDFVKTVKVDNRAVDYDAYLVLKQFGEDYLIVGESDLTTDRRIRHVPDLGMVVEIEEGELEDLTPMDAVPKDQKAGKSKLILVASLVLTGIVLLIYYRKRLKFDFSRGDSQPPDYHKMGYEFEKFIAGKFKARQPFFILMEWRGDKYHEGIYPESNRNPDMEYKFQMGNLARQFSVECKFRSRRRSGLISLMDQRKYLDYEHFHKHKMPVYIVLGYGGKPDNPDELYLIPFREVRRKMSKFELSRYRKSGEFYYDIDNDRLT